MSNTRELVWFDGPDDPKFVIVYDDHDVHYFYWPLEFIPAIKFIKPNDVEPLKKNHKEFISRFHYYGMTIWLKPETYESKKTCYFTDNFHVPIIISKNRSIKTLKIESFDQIGMIERIRYRFGVWWFKQDIKKTERQNPRDYSDKILKAERKPFDEKELFDKIFVEKFVKELIIIGDDKSIDNYIKKIEKNVKPLNAKGVSDYLNF